MSSLSSRGDGEGGEAKQRRGRKRTKSTSTTATKSGSARAPTAVFTQDTILQRLTCPAKYQYETFMFLYDFFMCRASTSPLQRQQQQSSSSLQLPSTNTYISNIISSTSQATMGGESTTNDEDVPIPIDELKEYRYEDHRYETSAELESKLRTFPRCRIIHEQLSVYPIMSYERTVRTITIVMEISVQILFRQCHLFLLQNGHHQHSSDRGGGNSCGSVLMALPPSSIRLSHRDVGRMFVEAWRNYVLQHKYGKSYPHTITLQCCHRHSGGSLDVIPYCKEQLDIHTFHTDEIILDYYSFEVDEIKKGTNLSRLTQSMKQLELGEHVNPTYVPLFSRLYNKIVVQSQRYLLLANEFTLTNQQQQQSTEGGGGEQEIQQQKKRGRKRRDPETIARLYEHETQLRSKWYDQQQQQQKQHQQASSTHTSLFTTYLLYVVMMY